MEREREKERERGNVPFEATKLFVKLKITG